MNNNKNRNLEVEKFIDVTLQPSLCLQYYGQIIYIMNRMAQIPYLGH